MKFANPMTEKLVGYSPQELAAMPFTEIIAPDDRQLVVDRYTRRLRGENVPNRYTFRVIRRDGTQLWTEINSVSINWEGRPASLSFLRDINDQKQAEEKRLQSEARLRTIFEVIPDLFFVVDRDGTCLEVKASQEYLFVPAQSLVGTKLSDFFPAKSTAA